MASSEDTFARLSELARQNYQFADQATRILIGFERSLRAANPGFHFILDDVIYETEPLSTDPDRNRWFKESYRLGWMKIQPVGWSLLCAVEYYYHDSPVSDENEDAESDWQRDDKGTQSFMIDSWPAAVRIAALRYLDKFTQELLDRVEALVADREETAMLIDEYSHLAEFDDRDGEGNQ